MVYSDSSSSGNLLLNSFDAVLDATLGMFPTRLIVVLFVACSVGVAAGFWVLTRSDWRRSQLVDAWQVSNLLERRALLDSLPDPLPATWRETVVALQDELDCLELGVTTEELPRARAKLEAIRAGVPTHEKDNVEQIYERIRLTQLREQRRHAVLHPLAPSQDKEAA